MVEGVKTINIPDDLHKKIKLQAVKNNTTVKEIIKDLLENEFGKSKDQKNIKKIGGTRKSAL